MRFALTILVYCLLAVPPLVLAQSARQAENWHFGSGISISFIGGQPVLSPPSSMITFEGACSLSDTLGNLLFYSNGGGRLPGNGGPDAADQDYGTIWNRNHEVMYDMRGEEGGGFSARQSALAMPAPGNNPNLYYLFTMEEAEFDIGGSVPGQPQGRGLSFFTIDRSLNGGLGGVVTADQRVQVPAYEGLDATPMADGRGFWVTSHNNTDGADGRFFVVPLTEEGVGEPVETQLPNGVGGRIKFSPDGSMVYQRGTVYAFDNTTGTVGEPLLTLPALSDNNATFTPDSRFLYGTQPVGVLSNVVVRYDLMTAELLPVEALENPTQVDDVLVNGAFQIGPNGNIYFLEQTFSLAGISYGLSEIRCVSSSVPTVTRNLIDLSAFAEDASFGNSPPQFVDAIFSVPFRSDTFTLDTATVSFCPDDTFELTAREEGLTYRWSTGDTTATILAPVSATYCVTITNECNTVIDCSTVDIQPAITASLALFTESEDLCTGEPIELTVTSGGGLESFVLRWEDGTTENPRSLNAVVDAVYAATVFSACGDSTVVEVMPDVDEFCDCEFAVPEIITPNGDRTNDLFRLFSNCPVSDYTLLVFNRWGQQVFNSSDPGQGWDGTVNGTPQNMDIYLYRIAFRLGDDTEVQTAEGSFSLIR